ncbi:pyridoxamine 5'-phosphate oxidase family protein [Marinomonas algicola]|uniref:2Fe-2S iron-sulfur cluster-binding protein n=1 Tax=Marinomonas algicola TaxID=2773454 RepID=UPI00174E8443|nr:pyridoxamine 5'-phosphate oxidase family protein [Marinomonas algicola]
MNQLPSSQFHNGEIAVQQRIGVADMVAQYSEGFIRPAMPDQHREFFSNLPMVVVGITDHDGYPWAMPLFGQPGFIQSPDAKTLDISSPLVLAETLKLNFNENQKIGFLGIELHTRRRNRMNGMISTIGQDGFSICVDQSFGNCPQYIQKRELTWVDKPYVYFDTQYLCLMHALDTRSTVLIESTDTFFIASRTNIFSSNERSGIDVSHRGGKPGFIKIEGDTLYFPDFSGNRFFNTLGNIQSDERVGLYFPNHATGDAVFISGDAQILWDAENAAEFEGAERIVSVKIRNSLFIDNYLPMRGDLKELSPSLIHTGTWQKIQTEHTSEGLARYRKFTITQKVQESQDISSFYFSPADGQAVSTYTPGQFLPIRIWQDGAGTPILRSYTLSRAPEKDTYRISVKREAKGLASRMLHDTFNIGDSIEVGQPAGQFTLASNDHAIVLLSGGVGITPMIAMLHGLIRDIEQGAKQRNVWFVHGTQHSASHAFVDELNTLAKQHTWLQVHTVYSQPKPSDKKGEQYDSFGRISADLLKQILPFDHFDFYLCGSVPFMRSLYSGLIATGVAKSNIYYEFFGEGSIEDNGVEPTPAAERAEIHFAKSNITAIWTPEEGTLLEFAEKQGLKPMYSCRTGNCGACSCKISAGDVSYANPTAYMPEEGKVLTCSALPAADTQIISLDL